jgi:diguanylate cyclase (GGDEF)-like protein
MDVGGPPTLTSVLHQNARVEAKTEACADEISAVNAMLKDELSSLRPSKNAEQGLTRSKQVEEKIGECAEELHAVNIAVPHEISERKKWESALASAQFRLIGAQIDLLEAQMQLARVREERERDRYFAFHDSLTGLPNRNLFRDRLEHALTNAKRYKHALAVMHIDLKGLQRINDAHSRYIGDKVLQIVAQRLLAEVRGTGTVSRYDGDQFLCLLEQPTDCNSAAAIAGAMGIAIAEPFEVEGLQLAVNARIGIAMYRRDGETADALTSNAEIAMYAAKRRDGGYALFDASD